MGGAIFMALEGPEEREICNQMREEIKERLEEQFFRLQVFYCTWLNENLSKGSRKSNEIVER